MITFDELNEQNHKITELTNILEHLLGDQTLCGSEVTCDLFFRYVEQVKSHLEVVDMNLYSSLLTHHDRRMRNTADRFMGGSKEIKRLFAAYLKKWCHMRQKELVIQEYDAFKRDTDEMFEMVLNRIQAETENLYPLVREISAEKSSAAA